MSEKTWIDRLETTGLRAILAKQDIITVLRMNAQRSIRIHKCDKVGERPRHVVFWGHVTDLVQDEQYDLVLTGRFSRVQS